MLTKYWRLGVRFGTSAAAVTLVAAGMAVAPAGAVVPACGATIVASIQLTGDMSCPGSALTVNAANVTIDLNGYKLVGPGPAVLPGPNQLTIAGVRVNNDHPGAVIKNGRIEGFQVGVSVFAGSHGAEMTGLTIVNNGTGIIISRTQAGATADNFFVHDNVVEASLGTGVSVLGNTHRFVNNQVINNGTAGFSINSNGSTFTRNLVAGNGVIGGVNNGVGIQLSGNGNTALGNNVERNASSGLNVNGSNNVVTANVIGQNGGNGTNVGGPSTATVLANNRIENNQYSGNGSPTNTFGALNVFSSSGTMITGNQVVGIRRATGVFIAANNTGVVITNNQSSQHNDGIIVVSGATSTRIIGNLSNLNTDDGIDVGAPGTLIQGNTANTNADGGFSVIAGVIDGGGNHAAGNAHFQCTAAIVC